MPSKKAVRKPRIITEVVTFLREIAAIMRLGKPHIGEADSAEILATRLDAYHGGSANLDPSKRKTRRRAKAK